MWGRVATRSSTHLPAAVATERDWGTPHCRAVSAVWGGLDRDGCLLSVQGSGNRAFMLPDAFRVGS